MVSMNIMMVSMAVLGAVLYMQVIICMHTMSEKYSTHCLNWARSEKIYSCLLFSGDKKKLFRRFKLVRVDSNPLFSGVWCSLDSSEHCANLLRPTIHVCHLLLILIYLRTGLIVLTQYG